MVEPLRRRTRSPDRRPYRLSAASNDLDMIGDDDHQTPRELEPEVIILGVALALLIVVALVRVAGV